MAPPCAAVLLATLFATWRLAWANSLVGPGAVGSYQGGGGGRRHGGYVRVSDPSVGFFVGGSNIREMNGLYVRSDPEGLSPNYEFQLAYKHDYTGWLLCLATASDEWKRSTGQATQWLLLDNDGLTRFRHAGDTLIPGSGERWSHVHQQPQQDESKPAGEQPRAKAGTAVTVAAEDDLEELPWQLVGVGAMDLFNKLRRYFKFYKHSVQRAIDGYDLPPMPHVPAGASDEQAPPAGLEVPSLPADWTCRDGELPAAVREAIDGAQQAGNPWAAAVLSVEVARCFRQVRDFKEAKEWRRRAAARFPRYKEALAEGGAALLDEGHYSEAVTAFETLLRVDRSWPSLDFWLVRAHAHQQRQQEAGAPDQNLQDLSGAASKYCVAWRQTGGCDPRGTREPRSDRGCYAEVDPGASGYCECKGQLGPAAESTCEHGKFTCANECWRKWAALGADVQSTVLEEPPQREEERDPCAADGGSAPDWCSPDHYFVLSVPCDFALDADTGESDQLKRSYKRRSLQLHPDKRGGSVRAFQRVSAANEVLADPERRRAYDEGDELRREPNEDGSEGPSHRERIQRKYFPERFGFEPFGDPHSDRKERAARDKRRLEQRRQDALARSSRQQQPHSEL